MSRPYCSTNLVLTHPLTNEHPNPSSVSSNQRQQCNNTSLHYTTLHYSQSIHDDDVDDNAPSNANIDAHYSIYTLLVVIGYWLVDAPLAGTGGNHPAIILQLPSSRK